MTTKRVLLDYLQDIRAYAEKAERFLADVSSATALEQDERTLLAVIRALEVIGEAAKQIPASVREKYPQVPWRGMAGMRDKMIHEYFGVDSEVVWRTVKEDIPRLKASMMVMLAEFEAHDEQVDPSDSLRP